MDSYKVLIIDFEVSTSSILTEHLSNLNYDIQIRNNDFNCDWFVSEIKSNKVDIIIFDMNDHHYIFDVLDKVQPELLNEIQIIFVSSSSEIAIKAFRYYNVVGYIPKPIEPECVKFSLRKAIRNIQKQKIIENKLKQINFNNDHDFISIPSIDKIDIIKKKNIIYCMAEGRYTTFFIEGGIKITSSKNIGDYEELLGIKNFFRIHNSYIVNVKHISKITKKDGYICELFTGKGIPIAKRRLENFNKFLKLK